jgi:hypothetical protein
MILFSLDKLQLMRVQTLNDLDAKRDRQDFHGVRDACVDIEILDTRIALLHQTGTVREL